MYKQLENKISSLTDPTAFNNKTFDELLAENVLLAKEILGEDWKPLESDPYMKKLRVLTLRQVHNQADKNETVKQLLVTTATKQDLDHLGASEGVFRDLGEYPYVNFEFTLLTAATTDLTIPHGLVLNSDDDQHKAILAESIFIEAGNLTGTGRVELQEYTYQSEVKTENIVTELTFAVEAKQLDIFSNGDDEEKDDRYRLRIIASNDKHSTAGSEEAYKYFVYSADSRIDDVSIPDDNEPLEVNIYIASFDGVDSVMINRVNEALNAKYTRPLGDDVKVFPAEKVEVNLTATIHLFDLLKQSEIDKKIRANFDNSFFIDQNFIQSDFIRKSHVDGVYKVESDFTDVTTTNKQIIDIKSINFNYVEAVL